MTEVNAASGAAVTHEIVFQPIVRLDDWQVVAYEALARFSDSRSPLTHLAEARAAGHIVELELELIASATKAAGELPPDVMVTMNASGETILDHRLGELLVDRTHEWGIELSELSAVASYGVLRDAVKELGVVLLIDDAGARHADIERVMQSTPSIVKVDKSVLQSAFDPAGDQQALGQYGAAARSVGALALAEGVETPAQARRLLESGFELGQGYLFGYPASAVTWARAAENR